jgi:hypothetical protein
MRCSVVDSLSPSVDQTGPTPMSTDQHADRPVLDARDAFTQLGRLSFEHTSMDELLQRIAELSKQVIPGVAEGPQSPDSALSGHRLGVLPAYRTSSPSAGPAPDRFAPCSSV